MPYGVIDLNQGFSPAQLNINLINAELEQLERLRSEDTPRRHVITHTSDQFVLNPKSILSTSSYRIPSQRKWKPKKLEKFVKILNFRILL